MEVIEVDCIILIILFGVGVPINLYAFIALNRNQLMHCWRILVNCRRYIPYFNSGHISVHQEIQLSRSSSNSEPTNSLKRSLNVSDIIICLGFTPLTAITSLLKQKWIAGNVMCKVLSFAFCALPFYLSPIIMVCISLDRVLCIRHITDVSNQHVIFRVKLVKIMIFASWMYSITMATPQLFVYSIDVIKITNSNNSHTVCSSTVYQAYVRSIGQNLSFIDLDHSTKVFITTYHYLHTVLTSWLPVGVILLSYAYVVAQLRKASKRRETTGSVNSDWIRHVASRTFKTASTLIVAYIVCWVPYSVLSIMGEVEYDYLFLLNRLIIVNSCINPFIYSSNLFCVTTNNTLAHGNQHDDEIENGIQLEHCAVDIEMKDIVSVV